MGIDSSFNRPFNARFGIRSSFLRPTKPSAVSSYPEATGGLEAPITDPVSGDAYTAHLYTDPGPHTFEVTEPGEFEIMLVGPGGPGGSVFGFVPSGGGSGGEVVFATITLAVGTYSVTVGTSPAPVLTGPALGTATTFDTLTARPGGRGSGQ